MCGIIDEKGRQWERCCECNRFTLFSMLGYQKPCAEHKHGRDLCVICADKLILSRRVDFNNIVPAKAWETVEI